MSTIKVTNIQNPNSGTNDIIIDASGNVDIGGFSADASAPVNSVNLDSSGRLLVGTSTSSQYTATTASIQLTSSDSAQDPRIQIKGNATTDQSAIDFGGGAQRHATIAGEDGDFIIFTNSVAGANNVTERMRISNSGTLTCVGVYNATGGSSANVVVNSAGTIFRSTSSAKYKTDIETVEDAYSDALLNCRPVWYRSICDLDCPEHSYWGFIAEEVAEIDPRLVHWKTIEVTYDENGSVVETPCDPEPEGVAYDRFVPHLLNLIKRQSETIAELQADVAALKAS